MVEGKIMAGPNKPQSEYRAGDKSVDLLLIHFQEHNRHLFGV